jgi:glycosyltransferase involved in cell wall biosynthesis
VSQRQTISGVVLALDSATGITDCLHSLSWADERVVLVDDATTDRTAQLARDAGAQVHHRKFTTFAEQRNAALELASSDWIMFVDSDERIPTTLAREIRSVAERDVSTVGYWVPRRNIICGRWIKHAGWYPDRQLRLLRKGHASYPTDLPVHEVARLDGPAGNLAEPLVHLNYSSLGEFWQRQRRYARIAAAGMIRRRERPRLRAVVGQPFREFSRRFLSDSGYREGPLGLALCLLVASGTLETYVRAVLRRA